MRPLTIIIAFQLYLQKPLRLSQENAPSRLALGKLSSITYTCTASHPKSIMCLLGQRKQSQLVRHVWSSTYVHVLIIISPWGSL